MVKRYVRHLLDQAAEVLRSQPIKVLSTTPPLIEAICADPELHAAVERTVETIIWAGTSFSPESLRQVEEVFFPDTTIVGIYGNTLMGVAPQRPRRPGDRHLACSSPTRRRCGSTWWTTTARWWTTVSAAGSG